MVNYWLFKSEPSVYSITDMEKDGKTYWEGVRNYQARNFLRSCSVGDKVLFYHSNAKPPGVVGVVTVVASGYPDPEQFDASSKYFDPKSSKDNPRWTVVDVEFDFAFDSIVSLDALKANPALSEMKVVQKGCRLSVMPVLEEEFLEVVRMSGK